MGGGFSAIFAQPLSTGFDRKTIYVCFLSDFTEQLLVPFKPGYLDCSRARVCEKNGEFKACVDIFV